MHSLHEVEAFRALIEADNDFHFIAGSHQALDALPQGNWIGGTIPYFMDPSGGVTDRNRVFVQSLPRALANEVTVDVVDTARLSGVYQRIPANGFAMMILPAFSDVHAQFAMDAPNYPGFATGPLIGWISGVHLDDIGKMPAEVFDGRDGRSYSDRGVVASVKLPQNRYAELGIVNLFKQGEGAAIEFPNGGWSAERAKIDGVEVDFAAWCRAQNVDVRLPLVADYSGAMINVSFQRIDDDKVAFYAPVFPGVTYRQAAPVGDYPTEFAKVAPDFEVAFACNCILNYLYAGLEGRKTSVSGPITFGEIAYQLLNQTMAWMRVRTFAG